MNAHGSVNDKMRIDANFFLRYGCAMTIPEEVESLEARAKDAGISVDELCERARIDRATWQRWKSGAVIPRLDRWRAVQAVLYPMDAAQ